jgi:sirohydrochlorin ferrochelatase
MNTDHPITAVLLIAHGSRRATANADLTQLAQLVVERTEYSLVEVSYLELAEPSIPNGGRTCVTRGATRVLMMPYFLSAGVHVANDLAEFRQQLQAEFPHVDFVLCPHLGLHPLMVDIVVDRLQQGVTATTLITTP